MNKRVRRAWWIGEGQPQGPACSWRDRLLAQADGGPGYMELLEGETSDGLACDLFSQVSVNKKFIESSMRQRMRIRWSGSNPVIGKWKAVVSSV